ncbi:ABC transporter substrate-binding protein [Halobacteriovorax sp. HLS]|uniref:substrate-binding periplasmic protein n=1 Tax=Halobacteriovorax sp. HLS TaxID=2234000 RepID=UPI000FD87823|nr:transporter substrate-binding domain-containing protein [Halobacteriovorax sp. HLS]
MKKLVSLLLIFISSSLLARPIEVVTDQYPPYIYYENGKLVGIQVEILSEVMSKIKIDYTLTVYPWKRCLQLMKNQNADLLLGVMKNSDREEFMFFPDEEIVNVSNKLFSLTNEKIKIKSNFQSKTIGTMRGYYYSETFMSYKFLNKMEANSHEQLLDLLFRKRVDYIIGAELVIRYGARKRGLPYYGLNYEFGKSQKHYVASSKGDLATSIVKRFSKELSSFKKTERYRELIKKYTF